MNLSKKEKKQWILENCINSDGDIDLSELDFSDFDGNVIISNMKVKKDLFQHNQQVESDLYQCFQEVKGDLAQDYQVVEGDLFQDEQTVAGKLWQDKIQDKKILNQ